MIPFFRKIRYQLAQDNQFFKYSRYAFGEIVLVIAGILVALYINQWNKDRLDIRYEKKMLSEIQKDLQSEVVNLESQNEKTIERIKKISMLDSLLKDKTPVYSISLDTLFGAVWGIHRYNMGNKAKYENLKSRGLHVVQVDSIKEQLMLVYEVIHPGFESLNAAETNQNDNVYLPYYIKNFTNFNFQTSATPVDFEFIWKDPEYHNVVSYRLKTLRLNQIPKYEYSLEQIANLQRMIANYLKPGKLKD